MRCAPHQPQMRALCISGNRVLKLTCHCENIEINVVAPQQVTSCNCSVCSRYQTLWGYYKPDEVGIDVGSFGAGSYIWGDKELEFVHCKNCGCVTHYRTIAGTSDHKVAVNFRMAPEELISEVPVRNFNGKELL